MDQICLFNRGCVFLRAVLQSICSIISKKFTFQLRRAFVLRAPKARSSRRSYALSATLKRNNRVQISEARFAFLFLIARARTFPPGYQRKGSCLTAFNNVVSAPLAWKIYPRKQKEIRWILVDKKLDRKRSEQRRWNVALMKNNVGILISVFINLY